MRWNSFTDSLERSVELRLLLDSVCVAAQFNVPNQSRLDRLKLSEMEWSYVEALLPLLKVYLLFLSYGRDHYYSHVYSVSAMPHSECWRARPLSSFKSSHLWTHSQMCSINTIPIPEPTLQFAMQPHVAASSLTNIIQGLTMLVSIAVLCVSYIYYCYPHWQLIQILYISGSSTLQNFLFRQIQLARSVAPNSTGVVEGGMGRPL